MELKPKPGGTQGILTSQHARQCIPVG